MRLSGSALLGVAGVLLLAGAVTLARSQAITPEADERPLTAAAHISTSIMAPPPAGEVLFGAQLQWDVDTPAAYVTRSDLVPAQFGDFQAFPLDTTAYATLETSVKQIAAQHSNLFLTLEPRRGLQQVTAATAREFATHLVQYNELGVNVYVRFGQEMNGAWYAWSLQPTAYINAFRILAEAVHRYAPGNVMVWSPNYGGGYPFDGSPYIPKPGTARFATLDTNHDGKISMVDDMYTPFYPGDAYVDWVGLTLYHFGRKFPWGANVVPEPDKFIQQLTGTYNGTEGDQRGVPNFYQEFAVGHHKPMALSETSALYNETNPTGASDLAIKSAWMNQLFAPEVPRAFPNLHMINWFEYRKVESGDYGTIDWRASMNGQALATLRTHLRGGDYILAPPA